MPCFVTFTARHSKVLSAMENAHIMLKTATKCSNYAFPFGLCFLRQIMLKIMLAYIMYQCLDAAILKCVTTVQSEPSCCVKLKQCVNSNGEMKQSRLGQVQAWKMVSHVVSPQNIITIVMCIFCRCDKSEQVNTKYLQWQSCQSETVRRAPLVRSPTTAGRFE